MPITGSQKAKMVSRLGVLRLGAGRLDYYTPVIKITINGVTRTNNIRVSELTIRDYLDGQPNIATMRVDGFTPTNGHEVKIGLGDLDVAHLLFAGHIQTVTQVYEAGNKNNVAFELTSVSYEWLLNRRKVNALSQGFSATVLAKALISNFTAGFTSDGVQTGLPVVDEITFTNEDVTDCLDRLAKRVGGYWYIDYARDLKFFTTAQGIVQSLTDGAVHGMRDLAVTTDLAPVKTRVYVEGGGGTVAIDVPVVGLTSLPIDDGSWYSASGGTVVTGAQRITYTSASNIKTGSTISVVRPSTGPTFNSSSASGGALGSGQYLAWRVSYVNANGESLLSSDSYPMPGATYWLTVSATETVTLNIPAGPSGTTARRLYRVHGAAANDLLRDTYTSYRFVAEIAGNSATTYTDGIAYASLGATAPEISTAEVGATVLPVADLAQFSGSGGWVRAGGIVVRYTGRSGSSGAGNLTGVPASGPGAITANLLAEIPVETMAMIAGIPASGPGSIIYPIAAGDPINLLVTRNDATAQTAMAGLVGGDGIHEEYLQDNRLSELESTSRGDARLAEVKDPLVTVRYDTTDQGTRSGKEVTINLGAPTSVSGTFKIQSVTISGFSANNAFFPRRAVEASSRRQSFEALLRILKAA